MEQKSAKNLLDLMTPEEQEFIKRRDKIRQKEKDNLITQEWLGMSELGFYFGWEAVRDVIDDVITIDQANMLVKGARKIHSGHVYDSSIAIVAGNSTVKGSFEKLMRPYIKDMDSVA